MIIEVWSDIVCPFCYIGKRRLEEALSKFPHKDEVRVEYRSFELQPDAQVDNDMDNIELLAKKYGTSKEQIIAKNQQLTIQAKEVGLTYHLDQLKPTNTYNAHRMVYLANQKGKENEMIERLFYAYFTEVKHVGDVQTLLELGIEVGLPEKEIRDLLDSDQFGENVRAQENDAQQIGVTGVPFYVLNRKYAISGAQPSNVFSETIEKVWKEEQQK